MAKRSPARSNAASRARGRRNAGTIVHKLLWSMSYDRPVRITLRDQAGTVTDRVVRRWTDEQRGPKPTDGKGSQASTVVVVLASGREIAVNSIESVQLPLEGTERAFGEHS